MTANHMKSRVNLPRSLRRTFEVLAPNLLDFGMVPRSIQSNDFFMSDRSANTDESTKGRHEDTCSTLLPSCHARVSASLMPTQLHSSTFALK